MLIRGGLEELLGCSVEVVIGLEQESSMNKSYRAFGSVACTLLVGGVLSAGVSGVALAGDGEYACDLNWFPSVDGPSGVVVDGDLVYVLNSKLGSGLEVYDYSDPGDPEVIGFAATDGQSYRLVLDGDFGYSSRSGSGVIDIFDLSDPLMPAVVGSYETSALFYEMDVSDGVLYISHTGVDDPIQGLEIVDVSEPTMAVQVGVVDLGDLIVRFDVDDGIGYFDLRDGLTGRVDIFELSEPTDPLLLGSYDFGGGFTREIVVDGSLMYVGTESGVQIVDVGSLGSPVLLGQVDVWAEDIHVAGDQIFLERGQVVQVDVSDPALPIIGKQYRSPGGFLVGVGALDDGVVVVDQSTGLHLADFVGEAGGGCERPCAVDLNRDGALDFFDIATFIRHKPDLTGELNFDFHDVVVFRTLFSEGNCN